MLRSRRGVLAGVCLLSTAVSAIYVPPVLATGGGPPDQLPGCQLARRAVAYRSGGVAVSRQPADAPVPCLVAAARDDFSGVDITPSGAPWAAFAASCPRPVESGNPSACAGMESSNPQANEAVAGRLAWPAAEP